MTIDLMMICGACGKPIVGEQRGCLWVDRAELERTEQAVAAWERRHNRAAGEADRSMVDSAALREYPARVPWQAHHGSCDPAPDAWAYDIGSDALRTYGQLLERTAHLMEKRWLLLTDWHEVLREVPHGKTRLIAARQTGDEE